MAINFLKINIGNRTRDLLTCSAVPQTIHLELHDVKCQKTVVFGLLRVI